MKLIDPATGQAVWDSNDPNAGPVPPAPEGRQWVRVDEPGDTMAPRRTAPGILDIGNGVTERLAFLNQTFNPVEGIGSAMRAGSRMMAPDQSYWDRIASLGEMASGVASIAAPIAAAKAIGVPAASAMMEGLLGFSPARQAAGDMATQFARSESGALPGGGPGRPPLTFDEVARAMQEAQPAPPSGFQNYLERVNPSGTRIAAEDRPNLMMGDMYGMLPRGARRVGRQGDVTFHRGPEGDFYATAFNPDVGEQDVVGYIMPRGDMTELAVVGEMQGKGVGSELQYLFRKENPDAPTGGLTEAGERSLRRTYDRLVSEGIVQPASAPKTAPLDVSRRDASNIFGEGSERVRYTDPQSGGTIEVVVRPDGSASVLELEVPEASRGQGIGQTLQERVMQDFPMMGGQVSSKAAATTAYRLGRRPPGKPDATLEEVFADIDEMSSVNMVSPAMQERLAPAAPALPTPRNEAEAMARDILQLRAEGRAGEVTDQMRAAADPQYMYLNTPLPMDYASRMARAAGRRDEFHGTTTGSEMTYADAFRGSGTRQGIGFVTSDNPYVSSSYADPQFGSVFPMLNQPIPENAPRLDLGGGIWSEIPEDLPVRLGDRSIPARRIAAGPADAGGVFSTNQISRGASFDYPGVEFSNILDRSIHAPRPRTDDGMEIMREFQRLSSEPSTVTMRHDTRGMRSRFALFDPEFAHLRNLSAGVGGAAVLTALGDDAEAGTPETQIMDLVKQSGVSGAAQILGVSRRDIEEAISIAVPPSQWDQLVVGPQ